MAGPLLTPKSVQFVNDIVIKYSIVFPLIDKRVQSRWEVRADKKQTRHKNAPPQKKTKTNQNTTQKQTSTHKKKLKYVNKWRSYQFK